MIGKDKITAMIPHGSGISVLDQVVGWDESNITCTTSSHCDAANPLAENGRFPTLCFVEYCAQAAAVHSALTASRVDEGGKPAYVGALKNIEWQHEYVDKDVGTVDIHAVLEASSSGGAIYSLEAKNKAEVLLTASITLIRRV